MGMGIPCWILAGSVPRFDAGVPWSPGPQPLAGGSRLWECFRRLVGPMKHFSRPSFSRPLATLALVAAIGSWSLHAAEEIFVKNCAPCHGPDGRARTPVARRLGVKDLTVSKVSDEEIVKSIKQGRPDKTGKLVMPSFDDKVTAPDIEALVKAVKALRK